jgi:dTDP-4-amino-4,6-dideoxygalactose transaminase
MKDSELQQVPQADPRRRFLARRREIEGAIARVLERGAFILGPEVAAFEAEFAAHATRSRSPRAPTRCASP